VSSQHVSLVVSCCVASSDTVEFLDIVLYQHVTVMDVLSLTGFSPLTNDSMSTFGYIAQLADNVPAPQALRCNVDASIGCPLPVACSI